MAKFLIILLFFPATAFAADPWTTQDTVLEGVYLGLVWIDIGQTGYHLHSPKRVYGRERNPLLGPRPSLETIRNYNAAAAILHIVIASALNHPYRGWFFIGTIFDRAYHVGDNGLGLRFLF